MMAAQGGSFDREGAGVPTPSAMPEYVPDPRDDPAWWTARKLLDEQRPREHRDGWGGTRKLWATCGCGAQRTVDLNILGVASGTRDRPIVDLNWRCRNCSGGQARLKLTWVNPPRIREDRKGQEGWKVAGKPRTGWFDFATGKRHGGWD